MHYSRSFFEQHQYTNNGPNVLLLEERLAALHKTDYCITFCNGFWALVLAISALARQGKTEIIIPSLTYRRMADVAAWANLKPNFCEIEEKSLSINAKAVKSKINDNTALILAVHPIINCCPADELVALAESENIPLLFDSVESAYESVNGRKVGGFGDAEVFSMHASKLINGFEGGYITTNNSELATKLAITRGFGFSGVDNVKIPGGMNAKLNEIHAAMALASLDDLEDQVIRNRKRYYLYRDLLKSVPGLRLLDFEENYPTSYKNIVVEILGEWPLNRDETVHRLNIENVLARAYYYPPLHHKDMLYPYVPAELPITDTLSKNFINLPCGHHVDDEDIKKTIYLLKSISKTDNNN